MTDAAQLEATIDAAWDDRDSLSTATTGAVRDAVGEALNGLDAGTFRVAEKGDDGWHVNQWLKKAVLLSFRLNDMGDHLGRPPTARPGSTRCRRSFSAGTTPASARPVSARYRTASFAIRPISRRTRF